MVFGLSWLLLAATSSASAPVGPSYNLFSLLQEPDVQAELEFRHQEANNHAELLEHVTRGLLGAPYDLSPLGEGSGRDEDPRFRLDVFDCTTFVETAMALAATDDLSHARALLDDIRYQEGQVGFQNRRHLVMSQWLPGLRAEGWLEDVTAEVGGSRTVTATVTLSAKKWARRRIARTLVLNEVPHGQFTLQYLELDAAEATVDKVPPGTLINILRRPWHRAPDYVTHQGVVVMVGKTKMVRHASPVSKRVIDEPLLRMIRRYLHPRTERKWPIVGVSYHRLRAPASLPPAG